MTQPTDRPELFGFPLPGHGLMIFSGALVLALWLAPVLFASALASARVDASSSFSRRVDEQALHTRRAANIVADWLVGRRSALAVVPEATELPVPELLTLLPDTPDVRTKARAGFARDGFGRPFLLVRTGPSTFDVVSRGADGEPGGSGASADVRVAR